MNENPTTENEKNLYNNLYALKGYKYRIKSIDNIQDLDIFISEFKNFIFDKDDLRVEYKNRISKFSNYIDNNNDILNKINRRIDKIVTHITGYNLDIDNIDKFFYFYSLRPIMGDYYPGHDITDINSITIEDGIACFYYLNIIRTLS